MAMKFFGKTDEKEDSNVSQATTRFIVDEPQTYKVVGYSVNPNTGSGRLSFNIGLSHNEPLNVLHYMDRLCR